MNLRKFLALSVCGVSLSFAPFVGAQQVQQAPPRANQAQPAVGQPRAGQVGQQTNWQNSDQMLANCIAIDNQKEITIAKMAADKAKNKDVKEFAQMLVKDHQAFLQKLQKLAPEATREGFLTERGAGATEEERRATSNQPDRQKVQPAVGEVKNASGQIQQTAAARNSSEAGQPIDVVQLHREIAEECIRSAQKGMKKKDGQEFDECFVGFQIAAHAAMKDKLVVFQRHASGELNQIIEEGIDATEKHLKKAEQLMKDLAGNDQSGSKASKNDGKKS